MLAEFQRATTYISSELRQINELFPEYTPHDKDYHISHLFGIADILLGKERYHYLNVVELYLLMVAMYAHDWGMAVSKDERYYIAANTARPGCGEINLLDDEKDRFEQFMYSQTGKRSFHNEEEIDIGIWQNYIRDTHALRSGKRIEKYYEKINGSVAHALSKICVGHWLHIEEINDKNGYYMDAPVFGENVNLKALTIYIRLIDLFDLAEDRTPYVIWKYVNPQNKYSKMEWEKHRALHQITCPSYESGRVVCISGSTDNHEVYASLMDFKNLCERYFRECSDALAHMNDKRHELGVYFLDWRIEARNFKPISIQFNFDRENIFKVLSDEIYNCHPYVFIRELIQNSVDAIELRKEVLDRKRVGGDNIGFIYFKVNDISEDELEVVCQDDGIGMDEYIVRNYFSVLGKSYYNSNDFEKERVGMSPISKFGIGVLSCFSVASQMTIYTFREPYTGRESEGLKIVINDIEKQFRVEEIARHRCEVGTKIVLRVEKSGLKSKLDYQNKDRKYDDMTSYIKKVMGFVHYPIIIEENQRKTVVHCQEYALHKLERQLGTSFGKYDLFCIPKEYPIEKVVPIRYIDNFNKIFTIRTFDLKDDLEIEGMEGQIVFPVLKDFSYEYLSSDFSRSLQVTKGDERLRIKWCGSFYDYVKIYNCGFGLENMRNRGSLFWKCEPNMDYFPSLYVNINYLKGIPDLSISRFSAKDNGDGIEIIWKKIFTIIKEEVREPLQRNNFYQFWRKVSAYQVQFYIDEQMLMDEFFASAKFPFLTDEGKLV